MAICLNRHIYTRPPTVEEINFVVKSSGLWAIEFEQLFNLSSRAITRARCGEKDIPAPHWHLFYKELERLGWDKPIPYREKIITELPKPHTIDEIFPKKKKTKKKPARKQNPIDLGAFSDLL